ncbi:MAG TPA: ribosome biogenesis factor YjgA [Pseudomonadales bacterium]
MNDPIDDRPPSRSQRKRDHHALIELARALAQLSDRVRKGLDLDESLHEPLQLASTMKPSSARERQLRYIAKLLEKIDHAAISDCLQEREKPSREKVALHHQAEAWRDRLLAEDQALDELLDAYPRAERSLLQTLILEARQQAAANRPPKAARQLFRQLRDLVTTE